MESPDQLVIVLNFTFSVNADKFSEIPSCQWRSWEVSNQVHIHWCRNSSDQLVPLWLLSSRIWNKQMWLHLRRPQVHIYINRTFLCHLGTKILFWKFGKPVFKISVKGCTLIDCPSPSNSILDWLPDMAVSLQGKIRGHRMLSPTPLPLAHITDYSALSSWGQMQPQNPSQHGSRQPLPIILEHPFKRKLILLNCPRDFPILFQNPLSDVFVCPSSQNLNHYW